MFWSNRARSSNAESIECPSTDRLLLKTRGLTVERQRLKSVHENDGIKMSHREPIAVRAICKNIES